MSVTITVKTSTGGTTSPSGSASYPIGSSVTLTATPLSGYTFFAWREVNSNGILDHRNNPFTFTATASVTFTPRFMASPSPPTLLNEQTYGTTPMEHFHLTVTLKLKNSFISEENYSGPYGILSSLVPMIQRVIENNCTTCTHFILKDYANPIFGGVNHTLILEVDADASSTILSETARRELRNLLSILPHSDNGIDFFTGTYELTLGYSLTDFEVVEEGNLFGIGLLTLGLMALGLYLLVKGSK